MINCEISEVDRRHYKLDKFDTFSTVEEFESNLCDFIESGAAVIWDDDKAVLGFAKALVDRINGLRIEVKANEHHPAHFHVVGTDVDACFTIKGGAYMVGKIGRREREFIEVWYEQARPNLIRIWNATRPTNCQVGPYQESEK